MQRLVSGAWGPPEARGILSSTRLRLDLMTSLPHQLGLHRDYLTAQCETDANVTRMMAIVTDVGDTVLVFWHTVSAGAKTGPDDSSPQAVGHDHHLIDPESPTLIPAAWLLIRSSSSFGCRHQN